MKKRIFLACLVLSLVGISQAQTAAQSTPAVECSSKTYFSDNQCEVCYEGGEVTPDTNGIKLKEVTMEWENELDGINQNFYETSQGIAEIKTNIGTAPNPWDETGLEWGSDVVWKDLDGLNMYSLDAGKTIQIKTIKADTNITLTSPKQPTDPYLVVKTPISYYELKMGTFNESEKKTKNYCVSYTPKKVAGTNSTTTSTGSNTSTTNNSSTTPSTNTSTTTTTNSTNTTSNNTTATNTSGTPSSTNTNSNSSAGANDEAIVDVPEAETNEINNAPTDDEIPSYDAKVTLNSAGTDPLASEASHVATGPAENLLLIAAVLLSIIMFPKMNQIFTRG
ncbi:hypothetical protein KA071_01555 [Candidatus Gracilibacteria bacterium]|nr:hypothetical protein [Candidatus Gracilibacteria bacterium]